MRTRLRLAEEWRPTRWAESPVHLVATVRDTRIVARPACHPKFRCAEAGVDRSAAGTEILAVPAPAHARNNRWRRAFPANCPAEASTCYRHNFSPGNMGKILIADAKSESTGPATIRASPRLPVPTCDATPNLSLNRTARRRRWGAVRSRPVSLVRYAHGVESRRAVSECDSPRWRRRAS
jgi:hypothetical protein